MKVCTSLYCFGIFLVASCNKENPPDIKLEYGVKIEIPYLWWNKEEEHDQSILSKEIINGDNFLGESHSNGVSSLALINGKTGKFSWKWNDYYVRYDLSIENPYLFDHYLIAQNGSPRTYCIDVRTGKSIWKKTWNNSIYFKCAGIGDSFFAIEENAENNLYPRVVELNVLTGEVIDKISVLFYNTTNKNVLNEFGAITNVKPFESNSKKYLLITYSEALNTSHSIPHMSLYNYTDKTWVYEYKRITHLEDYALGFVDIQNGKIYHDGASHVFCNDLWTGDSIWARKFTGNFLFGGCLVDNDIIYCASEGDGYYALDAKTGFSQWKGERAPGTSSRMVILNGVLYYINGGDGRLWALDASNGKTLWKIKSPDNYSFKREINVLPADGKRKGYILTSTWHGTIAYEAER